MGTDTKPQILIVDTGGQYCHLIARRVREQGVQSLICAPGEILSTLGGVRGVIISGGPESVYAPGSPKVSPELFRRDVPVLGICYGHQLLASALGGVVEPGHHHEYGEATLEVLGHDTILGGVEDRERVWMSHGDEVRKVPPNFEVLARSDSCPIAVMANTKDRWFGVQFHPEVTDTPCGGQIIRNFVFNVCGCETDWHPDQLLARLERDIRRQVGDRHVLFFVSGGVDSTVAFAICTDAVGPEQVTGVFVDTGLMRKGEREEIEQAFASKGWHNFRVVDASERFLSSLAGVYDPEVKRRIIGDAFVQVQRDLEGELALGAGGWMLGQGTIYPDTIESGGGARAALIKTHHNRVPSITKLIEEGLVLEPLKEFYKDEVRDIGRQLGLPEELVSKHPFPGPALAVRCLCASDEVAASTSPSMQDIAAQYGFSAWSVPLRTVGVQGDHRSYSNLVVLCGNAEIDEFATAARRITREIRGTNRVAFQAGPNDSTLIERARVVKSSITQDRLKVLREADFIVHQMLRSEGLWADVWQFPVVLLPLSATGGQTIALRPVSSSDAMTARHADLPIDFVRRVVTRLLQLPGIEMVLYDVSDKPPATIEWE